MAVTTRTEPVVREVEPAKVTLVLSEREAQTLASFLYYRCGGSGEGRLLLTDNPDSVLASLRAEGVTNDPSLLPFLRTS